MITMIDALFATLRGLIADQTRDLEMVVAELRNVEAERDSYKSGRADLAAVLATYSAERDTARQSLRASEQEVEELDTLCNDYRRANARLVTERDAAMQRADTAEAILRAKG